MNIISDIRRRAKYSKRRVVFPETRDPRVLRAVSFLHRQDIISPILVGNRSKIDNIARKEGIYINPEIETISFDLTTQQDRWVTSLYTKRRHKGLTREGARHLLEVNPLFFGAILVAEGYADAAVAGSLATTAEVISSAVQCIGLADDICVASSIFLIVLPDNRVFSFGDCGVVPYPDSKQLADIAIQSSKTHHLLTGQRPITALLSFSTKGSARHERVDMVKEALRTAREKEPDLQIDGELQFDAALVPDVAKRKSPGSEVAGNANVFIFPNLDAGNIAYKVAERLAKATAIGPILQGLQKPMMDLSRGCDWQDIVNAACVGVLMGEKEEHIKL